MQPKDAVPGQLVTVWPRAGITYECLNCSACATEDVTIHAGGNMGFLERGGEGGNTYRRLTIERVDDRLLALNADGSHSTDVGVGPTLEDVSIGHTGDDVVDGVRPRRAPRECVTSPTK